MDIENNDFVGHEGDGLQVSSLPDYPEFIEAVKNCRQSETRQFYMILQRKVAT
jgi:hypothetical protein